MPVLTDKLATSSEKFKAALEVIEKLPKEGPAKPSHQVMLTFYGLFKQATEGPCTKPKPWAFDVINKMKWEYWSKLGKMSKEEAMTQYVDALKKQIEDIPNSEDISEFMGVLGKFYSVAGISPPKSFTDQYDFSSVKTSASAESFSAIGDKPSDQENADKITSPITSDEEDYCDTSDVFENEIEDTSLPNHDNTGKRVRRSSLLYDFFQDNVELEVNENVSAVHQHPRDNVHDHKDQVYKKIEDSICNLQKGVRNINHRVDEIEKSIEKHGRWLGKARLKRSSQIFPGLPNESLALIILWPFVAHWLLQIFRGNRKQ